MAVEGFLDRKLKRMLKVGDIVLFYLWDDEKKVGAERPAVVARIDDSGTADLSVFLAGPRDEQFVGVHAHRMPVMLWMNASQSSDGTLRPHHWRWRP